MESLITSALLLVVGGGLTQLGAWLNEKRTERRRIQQKVEEGYLKWLNSEPIVLNKLKAVLYEAQEEPESLDAHTDLLERFQKADEDIQLLREALNIAFIYEKDSMKVNILVLRRRLYEAISKTIQVILRHHKTHQDTRLIVSQFKDRLRETEQLQANNNQTLRELENLSPGDDSMKIKQEEIRKSLEEMKNTLDQRRIDIASKISQGTDRIASCAKELSTHATSLLEDLSQVETESIKIS